MTHRSFTPSRYLQGGNAPVPSALHYVNGQVQRQRFFYWDNKKDYAFVADATYMIPKK